MSQLAAGERVGRYVVLCRLGSGGTGSVYSAFDPELDRKVALRVPAPPSGFSEARDSETRACFLAESQAVARLAHPNVVAIHDVGSSGGRVFVAMELVDGQTLSAWLASSGHPWLVVLEVFIAAGRGLAAAHAAGLVHRDFNIDSVIVGKDRRARVTGFGVARPAGGAAEVGATVASALRAEASVDALSDQFAFCVALYRALWKQHPFGEGQARGLAPDSELTELSTAREPPWNSGVARHAREAILKGLSADPRARHSSMDVLLERLARHPLVTAPRAGLVLVALVLVAASMVLWRGSKYATRCEDSGGQLAGIWDDGVRVRIRGAFQGTGLAYAQDTLARTDATLQAYAAAWAARQRAVCETKRSGMSTTLTEHEGLCLARRRTQLGALTALLGRGPDMELLQKALPAARGLESLEACGDARTQLTTMALPHDAALREKLSALEEVAADAEALYATGKYPEGLSVAEALVSKSEALAWEPLRARALLVLAQLHEGLGDYPAAERRLRAAIPLAARARDDRQVALAWAALLDVVGGRQAHTAEALALQLALETAAGRTTERGVKVRSALAVGWVHYEAGRLEDADRVGKAALRDVCGSDADCVAPMLSLLAAVNYSASLHDEALALDWRALALREPIFGPEHPETGASLLNIAQTLVGLGRTAEAQPILRRAWRILGASGAQESTRGFYTLNLLGVALGDQGQWEEGVALLRRALALAEQRLGPGHSDVAESLLGLGIAARELGRPDESRAHLERSLSIWRAQYGTTGVFTAVPLLELAKTEALLGRFERARALAGQAKAVRERASGAGTPGVAECIAVLADVERRAGRFPEARRLFEQAVPRLTEMGRAWFQFLDARALWQLESKRPRALALARASLETFKRAGHQPRVAELSKWLEHPTQ